MKTVLVLGGYGGFGARLSKRLAADGWAVLVAGRNEATARDFAKNLPNAQPVRADRNADLTPILEMHRPMLVIDAAGPFQGSDYRVAETCINCGVHYIDLADARDFVTGIAVLDERALAAGVVVLAGASSVPAMSGAVIAELSGDMDAVGGGSNKNGRPKAPAAFWMRVRLLGGDDLAAFPLVERKSL